jgi:hypothetical protein
MRVKKSTTKNNIPVLGLAFAMLLFSSELVKANDRPKILKNSNVEISQQENNPESLIGGDSCESAADNSFEVDEQKLVLVIKNWMEDSNYWSSEDLSSDKPKHSTMVEKKSDSNSNPGYSIIKSEPVVVINAANFISNSEF